MPVTTGSPPRVRKMPRVRADRPERALVAGRCCGRDGPSVSSTVPPVSKSSIAWMAASRTAGVPCSAAQPRPAAAVAPPIVRSAMTQYSCTSSSAVEMVHRLFLAHLDDTPTEGIVFRPYPTCRDHRLDALCSNWLPANIHFLETLGHHRTQLCLVYELHDSRPCRHGVFPPMLRQWGGLTRLHCVG
jgi:hypothetical protein